MPDTFTSLQRSQIMAKVRSKNTQPEMTVRHLVHALGYRYRLHVEQLPGTPDLVFPRLRKIINVSGCFWHMHTCGACRIPTSRRTYWTAKLRRNRTRDVANNRKLRRLQWKLLTVWECELKNIQKLSRRIEQFLAPRSR
jgi:DNA mismatch endonuclease (patch repair protein)